MHYLMYHYKLFLDPNDTTTFVYYQNAWFFSPTFAHLLPYRYSPVTGDGAIGVEFAGTAVTSTSAFGSHILPAAADAISAQLVAEKGNEDLQWSEGSYRGFFTITIDTKTLNATYYAMSNVCELPATISLMSI